MTGGQTRDIAALAAAMDLLPTPTVLIEPRTAAVLFANRAAHALAGVEFPMAADAAGFDEAYRLYDAAGERVPAQRAPGVRAARRSTTSRSTGTRPQRGSELAPGDVLVVFTDGMIEARAPEVIWSMEDVDAQLAAVAGLSLGELAQAFTRAATGEADAPLRDDLAVLGLKARA